MDPDLYMAVTEGDSNSLLKLFLQPDLCKLQNDQNKNSLLHVAAKYCKNEQVVKIICGHQPATILRSKNHSEDTALHIAARHNNVAVAKYLFGLAKDAGEAEILSKRFGMTKYKNGEGNTALHEAVLGRHREVIEVLLEWDKEAIFIKNKRKESPIYLASDRGLHVVLGKMLDVALEDEISKDMKNLPAYEGSAGKSLLHAAIANKHKLCINILLEKKKELVSKVDGDRRNPLHYTALFGLSEESRCILKIDSSSTAHQPDSDGLYPIHIAANEGYFGIVQDMLEYWPQAIETLNKENQNIVHLAALNGRPKLLSYMLHQKKRNKFDKLLNAKDINGNTPLHLATLYSHPKVVSILIKDGNVDMTILNNEGQTALDIAEKEQTDEISLPTVLCLTALRINNAPSGRPPPITKQDPVGSEIEVYLGDKFKERFNTLAVVATLILTVTFAAGFTIPGGYNADGPYRGMAILLRKPAFIVFVICNTIALYLSIIVVVNSIWAQWGDDRMMMLAVHLSSPLLGIALILMAIAFAAGLYSVILKLQWLAFMVLGIGIIFLLYILLLLFLFNVLHMSKYPVLKKVAKLGFYFLIYSFDSFIIYHQKYY